MPGAHVEADVWINEYITPWDIYSHGVTNILAAEQTPFQSMQVVESGAYGKGLVLDGKWQSCTGDEFLYHEPLVHIPCVFHGSPKRVLVLGGGEGATIREALRWNTVERATMVDLDGAVVEACKKHLPEMHQGAFDDPRTEVVIGDALDYLERDDVLGSWDIIISDLSDPIEDGPSFKLFTKEYFELVKAALAPGGIVVIQAGSVPPHDLRQHARLRKTAEAVFGPALSYTSHIPSYGAPWSYIVARRDASEGELNERPEPEAIDALLAERTTGGLRMLDGRSMLGMLQAPLHLRQAIEAETAIYTLDAPMKFFGSGSVAEA